MSNASTLSGKSILGQITVRLLHDTERARFDELLEERHYLKSARVGGRSLRYVAELNGEWIALICFSGAAPHLAAREEWIGWSPTQLARRLGFVVNNSRYLLLTDRHVYPNMGSKVLSLCLKRLSADWEQAWNQPVLVVESFVDEHLGYEGTCYKACGFEAVGPSAGYGRSSRDYYVKHDRPKQLYLRALNGRARKWLSQARMPAALTVHELDRTGPCPFKAEALGSLLDLFKSFKDERRGHGLLHRQSFVLACATVGMLMGADSYAGLEDETGKLNQRQLRALGARKDKNTGRYRAPSDSTFFRVLGTVDAAAFDSIVGEWMSLRELDTLKRIAVDGKTLRGSKRGEDGKALQLLSAVTHKLRLTIAQREIEEKSNETPALIPLLESIPRLEGSLISADAMQCQQEGCDYITQQRGADYLIGLKGNQSGILARAELKLPREFFSPRT
ncbi:MAG: ISAs1 family transposase [Puniceicoccaceae bacterium]|nr:MAG: ISAs1 family transposase [Puniceicoccaceae bacterium]